MKRIQKQVHCPQMASKLDDQLPAPPVNSSSPKNKIVNSMGPVNVFARQCEQSNTPSAANKWQKESLLQSHTLNENTACVKKQPVLQER